MQTERQMQQKFLLKDGDFESTKDMLNRVAKLIPEKNILAELDKQKNIVYHTAKDLYKEVEAIGEALIDNKLENKHIAICADNSYRYVVCDLAIAGGVGIVSPIDRDAPSELLESLLNKCEATAVICSAHIVKRIEEIKTNCPHLKQIITIDEKVDGYTSYKELLLKGKKLTKYKYYRNKKLDLNKTVEILFTSGTTGPNKGVMLSQNNLAANIINCLDTIVGGDDKTNTSMSVLPMHHATEINTHILPRIASGRLTYINDSMKNLMTNIKIFKPYVITIVPMIANAFYKAIWTNATKAGKDKKLQKGIKLIKFLRKFFHIDISHKLLKEVYEPFGDNLKQIVCGGAMLNPEVVKGFNDLGVFIINGYGITECGPLVSMNSNTLSYFDSVGKICPNLEYKLCRTDGNGVGELCIKGKSISKGYFKDEDATSKVFDEDGYFHTGDLAKIIDDRVYLTGRKKNVIILDNGKNVCPEEIENTLENNIPYLKDVVVYQVEKQTGKTIQTIICAGIFIEDEIVRTNKEKILEDFRKVNLLLPNYKRINYINIVNEEYEKTSTKKIKRDKVLERHNSEAGISV